MRLAVKGATPADSGTFRQMAPSSLDATVAVGKQPGVSVEAHKLGALPDTIEVAPFSLSIYSYPVE